MTETNEKAKGLKDNEVGQSDVDPVVSGVAGERLLAHLKNSLAMNKKTDKEIADLLIEHVWADFDIDSIQSAIVNAAIERLDR